MNWPGILTAMVTPFWADGTLNAGETEQLARWLVAHGSGGLVVAGTTGESPTLKGLERWRLFEASKQGAGDAPVWVGCGSNDTQETVERAREAAEWGADGIMVVTPYYNKPPQEGLLRHFQAVAEAVSVPVMIYNVPGRTGVSIQPETVARITEACPNVSAVKEAAGTVDAIQAMIEACPSVHVYAGDDALFYSAVSAGAQGVVSVASHVIGPEMDRLAMLVALGRDDEARALNEELMPIMRGLFSWPNPIPVKWVLNRLGHAVGPVRLPLVYPSDTAALDGVLGQIHAVGQREIAQRHVL